MSDYIDSIENKMFHGINLKYYHTKLEELKIFEQILKSGKIMTRNDLKKIKYEYFSYLPKIYEQDENEICFAMHPKNKEFCYVYDEEDLSSAFYQYIRFNISFVFSESILNNYNLQNGIPGEIRISNSLNLYGNLVAIGCFDEIEYLLEMVETGKKRNIMFGKQLISSKDIHKYVLEKKKRTYNIKEILMNYGYNVPIIDPITGKKIDCNYEEDIETVKKLKNILIYK